jgi:hypothetical protein
MGKTPPFAGTPCETDIQQSSRCLRCNAISSAFLVISEIAAWPFFLTSARTIPRLEGYLKRCRSCINLAASASASEYESSFRRSPLNLSGFLKHFEE